MGLQRQPLSGTFDLLVAKVWVLIECVQRDGTMNHNVITYLRLEN